MALLSLRFRITEEEFSKRGTIVAERRKKTVMEERPHRKEARLLQGRTDTMEKWLMYCMETYATSYTKYYLAK